VLPYLFTYKLSLANAFGKKYGKFSAISQDLNFSKNLPEHPFKKALLSGNMLKVITSTNYW